MPTSIQLRDDYNTLMEIQRDVTSLLNTVVSETQNLIRGEYTTNTYLGQAQWRGVPGSNRTAVRTAHENLPGLSMALDISNGVVINSCIIRKSGGNIVISASGSMGLSFVRGLLSNNGDNDNE